MTTEEYAEDVAAAHALFALAAVQIESRYRRVVAALKWKKAKKWEYQRAFAIKAQHLAAKQAERDEAIEILKDELA